MIEMKTHIIMQGIESIRLLLQPVHHGNVAHKLQVRDMHRSILITDILRGAFSLSDTVSLVGISKIFGTVEHVN